MRAEAECEQNTARIDPGPRGAPKHVERRDVEFALLALLSREYPEVERAFTASTSQTDRR